MLSECLSGRLQMWTVGPDSRQKFIMYTHANSQRGIYRLFLNITSMILAIFDVLLFYPILFICIILLLFVLFMEYIFEGV